MTVRPESFDRPFKMNALSQLQSIIPVVRVQSCQEFCTENAMNDSAA